MTRKTPIDSFGPELLTALIEGSKRNFTLELPYASAVKFRQRLYQLRNAMRESTHPLYFAVAKTRVTIEFPEGTKLTRNHKGLKWPEDRSTLCSVVIAPNDSEFALALAKSGVKVEELTADPLSIPSTVLDPLKAYLPEE